MNRFLGYHGAFAGNNASGQAADIRYAVISYPGAPNFSARSQGFASALDEMTSVASHETAESATDPDVNYKVLGWYDDDLNGEIGDLTQLTSVYKGYVVQDVVDQNDNPIAPAVPLPLLSRVNSLTLPRYVPDTISYATLLANSDAAIGQTGDTLGFRIESITSGTLSITHYNVTVVVQAGTTIVQAGDTLTWTSAARASGFAPAFTVTAFDVSTSVASAAAVQVNVNLVNVAPTLSAIGTLGPADQQTPFAISYATLLGASNAQDTNNDTLQFQIIGVANGSLTITHNGVTTSVAATSTLFGPGDTLTWTGATGISGSAVNAFTVSVFDGSLNSSTAAQVNINVRGFGAAFDLSGPWAINSSSGALLGVGQITQSGSGLTFVNLNDVSSSGQYTAVNQVVASNFDNQASDAGTVDMSTADDGRIVWGDGTVWLRISLGGQYSVSTPGTGSLTLASISQNGNSLTLVNGSTSATASITSATGLQVSASGSNSTATYGDGQIVFGSNGQVWTRLDLPPDFSSPGGAATHVIQNGTTSLVFVDKFGNTSPGYWLNPTQVFATGWNEVGMVGTGTISWADGTVWSEKLVLHAARNGSASETIAAVPNQIVVTNYLNGKGATVLIIQTGTTSLVFVDGLGNLVLGSYINATQATSSTWPGDIATFRGNQVNWSDGTIWTQASSSTSKIVVTDFTNPNGVPVHVVQNGTNTLVFIDGNGNTSLGALLSATLASAVLYPGDLATLVSATVTWADGTVWTKTKSLPLFVTAAEASGAVSHIQLLSAKTLVGLDGPVSGLTGTRQIGQIIWSDGTIWDDFDDNALNALFQMATGYP